MEDQWDELFDEIYLTTYGALTDRDASGDALAAVQLLGLEPGADVLDAPCGFGRHAIPLARAGYRVTGVDRSPVQLEEGRRRAGDASALQFVHADFRDLPLPDGAFDGVLCLFTSIGYRGEEGDRQMLSEFRRVSRPDGRLLIETMHRDRLAKILQPRMWEPLEEGALVLEERTFDQPSGMNKVTHTLLSADGTRRSIDYEIRIYTATELATLVRDAGFVDLQFFGNFEGEPLTIESRLVLVARAP